MKLRRFLPPEGIRLELRTRPVPEGEHSEDFDPQSEENRDRVREEVLREIVELFESTGGVANPSRLFRDLHNREKRASTAVGKGVVIPHVRTLQVRSFVMVFGRSSEGLPYDTPDGEPAHLFFGLAAPPYDDRTYLRVYKSLAGLLLDPLHYDEFSRADDPSRILRTLEVIC
jgi:PTS system fructose-specific IIC component